MLYFLKKVNFKYFCHFQQEVRQDHPEYPNYGYGEDRTFEEMEAARVLSLLRAGGYQTDENVFTTPKKIEGAARSEDGIPGPSSSSRPRVKEETSSSSNLKQEPENQNSRSGDNTENQMQKMVSIV